ncbi:hypothetical protein PC129_g15274 [Phytophthora cactorum]|uniref:Uncharacterized protein n=1 Tax=Phytophthora cactorum TaxID=29920 RepID=A0A329RLW4_9STRA|nr:hypothetical protein Pcac1_g5990 [Phytophthora cactorum]KAG2808850.1 hypothetical protein PC112_g16773 [Phytophthora cactorum]KAG2809657.1 hypothetical protein PC111_g15971 [Phytophthora cactorum]KAG2850375.1 hypothetical protein PC113_g16837 [Phytophthora cactorum]KAG2888695.1 hypothetical protein PC114_g18310 [Phytophthora cactorum]
MANDSAVPATPMKTGGSRGEDLDADLFTPRLDAIAESSVCFDIPVDASDAKEENVNVDFDDDTRRRTTSRVLRRMP